MADLPRQQFAADLLDQAKWFLAAADLLAAAALLEPQIAQWWAAFARRSHGEDVRDPHRRVHRQYLMLVGFAVENLCKGALITRLTQEARSGVAVTGRLPQNLKRHALLELLESVEFELDPTDIGIVPRLEMCSTWYGRYPVPIDVDSHFWQRLPSGTRIPTGLFSQLDVDQVQEFIGRLKKHVGFTDPPASLLAYDA